MKACSKNTSEMALFLLSKGAQPRGSEFHEACSRGFIDLASALIRRGANINAVDSENRTVLDRAVEEDQLETVRWLIAHGADINLVKDEDESALQYACKMGNSEMALFLLSNGALLRGSELQYACRSGSIDVASALIRHGADVNAVNYESMTPVEVAIKYEQPEMEKFLITQGAKPSHHSRLY
jgi:ankyrin repeat protein